MKLGAFDYITKPFKVDELQLSIQRALDQPEHLVRENLQPAADREGEEMPV